MKDSFERAAVDFVERIANWDNQAVLLCDTARLRKTAQDIMKMRANPAVPNNPERA